ncbi:MAG TPA: beta-ketoacyl-ACP synthase II [Candidatus Hydrogenedentes bacterium]|nr:beta-ketoacyl-ACP synthase II [Candidatus Hydrogenedentota bacterium]
MNTKIVVTGMGVVSPAGNTVDDFWSNLCAGRSGIRAITHFKTDKIASKIGGVAEDVVPAGMGPKEIRRQSRFTLFAMEAADQAWRQSGLDIAKENPFRCGVYFGSGIGGIDHIEQNTVKNHLEGPRRISPFVMPQGLTNMAAGVVGIRLGLKGPNLAIVTACATGAHCIGTAADAIRLGKADMMIAGGVETPVIPFGLASFSAMRALSTRNHEPERASRPFDLDRDGFVMSEGAGALVLESESHAKARGAEILAEVAGTGESCDAYHVTAPDPEGIGAAEAMRAALAQAGINPEEIVYYNAHGTSTKLNDASETRSLQLVFGENMPLVSSTKSMIGHLLGAAGAVEAIASIQSILTGIITPNINYETPDPECRVNLVANEAREVTVTSVMSNSLGFGGHNATLIFRRYA